MQVKVYCVGIKVSQAWVLPDGSACKEVSHSVKGVAGVRSDLDQMSVGASCSPVVECPNCIL